MVWSLYEEAPFNDRPIVAFQFNQNKNKLFKADEKTVHCGFHINQEKEFYFKQLPRRKLLFSLLRDNVFPKVLEDLKAVKGEMLEVINIYSTGQTAWRQLWLLREAIKRAGHQNAEENRKYKSCPYSSITVELTV